MATPILQDDWTGADVTIAEIERELARLRYASAAETAQPNLRTSVMTHIAWVPPEWLGAAEETLAGMAERHPSRTLLLVPRPDQADGIDAELSIRCFPVGDRAVCGEVIELSLRGVRSQAPASIVLPLLVSDLPVFCRWRGEPPFGASPFEQLVDIVDRLVVDTAEWSDSRYAALLELFGRTAVSDIAWARTAGWRAELARYWPSIREQEIYVRGPRAEATLLRAWLGARLGRAIRAVAEADEIGVRLGGEEVAAPHGANPTPSDLLSAQLDRYGRDPIYEEAVAAAAASEG
jgi:Glucose-6-phosphate dehydrogenase subunit